MNAPLLAAGCLALAAAGIHGIGGEILVTRRLTTDALPSSRFGGPDMTRAMIWASWHLTTVAFLSVATGLVLSGSVLDGDLSRGVALVAAGAASGFAALVVGIALHRGGALGLLQHPAPIGLTTVAVLAWWGIAI